MKPQENNLQPSAKPTEKIESTAAPESPITQSTKNRKTIIIVCSICCALIIAAIFCYFFIIKKNADEQSGGQEREDNNISEAQNEEENNNIPSTQGKEETSSTGYSKELACLNEYGEESCGIILQIADAIKGINIDGVDIGTKYSNTENGAMYRPEYLMAATSKLASGYSYEISVELDYDNISSEMLDRIENELNLAEEKTFAENGFVKKETIVGDLMDVVEYVNDKSNIVCNQQNYSRLVVCTALNYYLIKEGSDEANYINGLAQAYKEYVDAQNGAAGSWSEGILFDSDMSKIEDSAYAPYQTTVAEFLGAVDLFYRKSPTSKWEYFTGTQTTISCDQYNTEDLKKAYYGKECGIKEDNRIIGTGTVSL